MSLVLITPPMNAPVTLSEAKAHLRVDHDDEDSLIDGLIAAATARLDGRDGLLGRCLITQTWQATIAVPRATITLPLSPHQAVDHVSYHEENSGSITIDPATYVVERLNSAHPAVLSRVGGTAWRHSVSVTFTAGYGDAPEDIPAPIREAILLLVGAWYENREAAAIGVSVSALPDGIGLEALLGDYRSWSF